jgi:NAD(P)-dependent dehydrogenase (short-subunit alcohol dehydrogenase family)
MMQFDEASQRNFAAIVSIEIGRTKQMKQPEDERRRSAMTASRRIGEPNDIADVVAFLASDRSAYVNGTEVVVDGGFESMLMDLVPRPGFEADQAAQITHATQAGRPVGA